MNETLSFVGSTVKAYTENDVRIIGLGNDDESPSEYVVVSRYDDPSAPDEPRDNMIGIQTSTSDYEVRGVISSITLSRKSIEIILRNAKTATGSVETIRVDFNVDDAIFDSLSNYFDLICSGSSIVFSKNIPG